MAVLVEHTGTGKRYLLLGTGLGQWASARPNRLLGDLFAKESGGTTTMCCVCDYRGSLGWVASDQVRVLSIDGEAVGDAFYAAEKELDCG